jgi:hypothetical protein
MLKQDPISRIDATSALTDKFFNEMTLFLEN